MRLITRVFVFFVLTLAVLVSIDAYLEYTHERALIREGMARGARVLGNAMSSMVGDALRVNGMKQARELIADANKGESDILVRWVWLDARPGEPLAPSVVSEKDLSASLSKGELVEGGANEQKLYSYFSVSTGQNRAGALELSQSTDALSRRAARTFRRSLIQLVALFLVSSVTVFFVGARLIGRPLARLMEKIDSVGKGDLSEPLMLSSRNELTQLADGLNTMCERLSQSQARVFEETAAKIAAINQARHADRLRTVGQLASGVAHEVGTPLNVVSGRATLIAEGKLDGAQVRESAEIIVAQADRITEIVRQLLVFARRGSSDRERVDVERAVRQSVAMVEPVARKKGVTLDVSACTPGETLTEANRSALLQVLTNLIINAIQASATGSTVRVKIHVEIAAPPDDPEAAKREHVRVDVRDSGEGISEDRLLHIFEPFYTTKEVGEGTGLGLPLVYGILQDHDGWITVTSKLTEGSCFTFYLPAIKT